MKIGTNTTLYFKCIVRQDFCWATSSRPSARTTTRWHYTSIEEAWILSLDNDNDTSRNDSSDNTRIPFRLWTHKYLDSCQLSNNHDPLTVLQRPRKIAIVDHRMRMFSDTAVIVKIPSEWENVSIIEYDHVSPLKRGSIVFVSDRKWEVMSERAIGEGETPFPVIRLPFLIWNHCCGRRNHRMACRRNHVTNRVVFIIHYFFLMTT